MNAQDFEEKLKKMAKPGFDTLKHQEMLANSISKAKNRSILSWWWLVIPLYLIAMLVMKSLFLPNTSLLSNLHDLAAKQKFLAVIFFLILPVLIIILNFASIRKVFYMSGNPKVVKFLPVVWPNILMIVLSILVLLIYSL